jgi:hypothetical protein
VRDPIRATEDPEMRRFAGSFLSFISSKDRLWQAVSVAAKLLSGRISDL